MISAAKHILRLVMAAFVLGAVVAEPVHAEQRRPLLMAGKSSVYQRILTRPGATLHERPNSPAEQTFPPFQSFYIFGLEPGWIEIGPSISQPPVGWMKAGSVVEWKQNIVAAFTNASGRNRQILFESNEKLLDLMESENVRARQASLLEMADSGTLDPNEGIIAVEPQEYIDIVQNPYIMPILTTESIPHPLNYQDTLLMEIASIPKQTGEKASGPVVDNFDAGIVFVFDTTLSMDRYIDATRKVTERIVQGMQGTDVGDRVHFGLMAFRDSVEAVPGLEYRTRMLLPLDRANTPEQVVDTIRAATIVATASSPGFNEDSYAGIEDAIDLTQWEPANSDPFDARYIILVTDAGPNDPSDPNTRSRIGPAELQLSAESKRIAIMTLHIKTDAGGAAQHTYAENQYRLLSRFNNNSYYYGIDGGSVAAYEETVSRVVTALTDTIRMARGDAPLLSQDEAGQELVELGLAMQLAYLGQQPGVAPPDILKAWVSDRAVENPDKLAVEPRLLVSKNELATMAEFLSDILDLGEQNRGQEDASRFFSQIQGVVARMAQDPNRLVDASADTVGGALEFIEGLPYQSQLMLLTEETWSQSAVNRRTTLDGLRQKLVQYRKWLRDPAIWTRPYDGAPDSEYFFAMPFDVLP
jgi:serine/threonine-protein kinase PpkA